MRYHLIRKTTKIPLLLWLFLLAQTVMENRYTEKKRHKWKAGKKTWAWVNQLHRTEKRSKTASMINRSISGLWGFQSLLSASLKWNVMCYNLLLCFRAKEGPVQHTLANYRLSISFHICPLVTLHFRQSNRPFWASDKPALTKSN